MMYTFTLTNRDYKNSYYEKDFGNEGLPTYDKLIGIKKMLLPRSFFKDNDLIFSIISDDLDKPGCTMHDFEYRRMLTFASVDFIDDDSGYCTYEPSIIDYKKIYPGNKQESIDYKKRSLTFRLVDNKTGVCIHIDDEFSIEFSIDWVM